MMSFLPGTLVRTAAVVWLVVVVVMNTRSHAAGPSVVKSDQANIRAQPTPRSEVVARLRKGQSVSVLGEIDATSPQPGEPRRWARVALPPKSTAWVAANLVDKATHEVKVNGLHLRAGPGRNFSSMGTLPKGTKVTEIRIQEGWMQIEPPAGIAGYVAADLLSPSAQAPSSATATNVAAVVNRAARAQDARPVSRAGQVPAPQPYRGSMAAREVPPGGSLPPVAPVSAMPEPGAGRESARTAPRAQPVPPPSGASAGSGQALPPPVYSASNSAGSGAAAGPGVPAPSVPSPRVESVTTEYKVVPRVVHREGTLILSLVPNGPTHYELQSIHRREGVMNFVYNDDPRIDLGPYQNRRVYITGEEWVDDRWPRKPLLKVQSITEAN